MPAQPPPLAELAPGLSAAGKLDRDDIDALAAAGVRTIVNNRPDDEDPGQLPAAEARRIAEAHGIAYHHIPMTAVTLTRGDVDAMQAVLAGAEQPMVLHCRSGTRSTLLWSLVRMREGADPAALVAAAAGNGIDIAVLPAIAARLGQARSELAAEPQWLSIEAVVAFNREEVEKTGEPHELRDRAALQRALAHAWNVWVYFMDRDIGVLTARLYTELANAHAFAAGNKRTAFRAAVAFIEANGYEFDMPQQRHPIDRLLGYFDGKLSQSGVVEWFRLWMTPR